MRDFLKEGAAIVFGLSIEDAELITPSQRTRFKTAFFNLLWNLAFNNPEFRQGIRDSLAVIEEGLELGYSRDIIENQLREMSELGAEITLQ